MGMVNRLVLLSVLLTTVTASAQDKAEPKYEMTTYQWVFFTRGANHPTLPDAEREALQKGHIANLERLGAAGKGLMAGPLGDSGQIRGIVVLEHQIGGRGKAGVQRRSLCQSRNAEAGNL